MRVYSCCVYEWDADKQKYKMVSSESEEYYGKVVLCKGGGGGDQTTTVRYAPYIESKHDSFLTIVQSKRAAVIDNSPFTNYEDIEVDDAFFGAGYTIASFPSLYDMYGKFMAGLDIEVLWSQEFEDTINAPVVNDLVSAEAALLDDEIKETSIPRLQIGMRDIGSVMSSTFVTGKALIEDTRAKTIAKFSADLKYRLIPVVEQRWQTHLDWNKQVVAIYSEIMKFYFSAKTDVDETNYAMAAKNKLWPFTVLDFERAALGALQGAVNEKKDVAGASTTAKVLSGALSGAAMGAMVGSAWNTPAVAATATAPAIPASAAGSMWGAGIGAGLGIASALTY